MSTREVRSHISLFRSQWVAACPLPSYQREIRSLFDELIHRTWGRSEWQPDADVLETAHGFIIEFDLPGVEESTVQIKVEGSRLILEGERRLQYPDDLVRLHLSERPEGRFRRTFEFQSPIDADRVRKFCTNGILTVIVAKDQEGEESK